jgi:hypothetical protein
MLRSEVRYFSAASRVRGAPGMRGNLRPVEVAVVPAELDQRGVAGYAVFDVVLHHFEALRSRVPEFGAVHDGDAELFAATSAAVVLE